MANNLEQKMQARLDAWRKKGESKAEPEKKPSQSEKNYVPRGDYGDDIRDFEKKDQEAWDKEFNSNPIYQGYR